MLTTQNADTCKSCSIIIVFNLMKFCIYKVKDLFPIITSIIPAIGNRIVNKNLVKCFSKNPLAS